MCVNEQSFRSVHSPKFTRASRKCEDLGIDEIPIHDGIPHRLLHCKGRRECRWLLCGSRRLGTPNTSRHRRREQMSVAGVWRNWVWLIWTDRFWKRSDRYAGAIFIHDDNHSWACLSIFSVLAQHRRGVHTFQFLMSISTGYPRESGG
jgi:hypothetical protein